MIRSICLAILACSVTAHGHRLSSREKEPEFPVTGHLQSALEKAGKNRDTLEKVLTHYHRSGDRQKFRAACFLIENMAPHAFVEIGVFNKKKEQVEFDARDHDTLQLAQQRFEELSKEHGGINYGKAKEERDLETIGFELLTENIDLAIETWRTKPWLKNMSFEVFCEYILPHRSSGEPLDNWRSKIIERSTPFAADLKTNDYTEAAEHIKENVKKWVRFKNIYYMHPTDQSYADMVQSSLGRCEDISNMHNFAMRANGIATASDYTPYWARGNNNHAWKVTLDDQGVGIGGLGVRGRAAKVYRKMYSIQRDALYFQNKQKEPLPRWLAGQTYRDVTEQYMETTDVTVTLEVPKPEKTEFAYLCVFNGGSWKPIHWGHVENQKAVFTKMGPNIAYLPAYYADGKIIPAASPLLLKTDGSIEKLDRLGKDAPKIRFTHTKPQRYDVDRNIVNEKERIVEGASYTLKKWENGKWNNLKTLTAEDSSLDLNGLRGRTLYWVVKKGSRKLERIFTVEDGQVAWW